MKIRHCIHAYSVLPYRYIHTWWDNSMELDSDSTAASTPLRANLLGVDLVGY